jgi:hypothetical protein
MNFKSTPRWLWIVASAIALIATEKMPYGYYTLTRIVVCAFAVYLAYAGWDAGVFSRLWSITFGLVAALFNPILPVYLTRRTWFPIDVSVALLFAAHLAFILLTSKRDRSTTGM